MSDPAPAPPKPRRKALWIVLGVVGLILASAVGIYLDAWISAGRVIERERAEVSRRIDDLRQQRVLRPNLFEPAEEGNAWPLIMKAWSFIAAIPKVDLEVLPEFDGEPQVDPAITERLLASVQPTVDELKAALRRPWVEPDHPYDQHAVMETPHLRPGIRVFRLLAATARRRHEVGKDEEAIEYLVTGLGLSDCLSVKGTIICELVSFVGQSIALEGLKQILADHDLSPPALDRLSRALDRLDAARPDLMECLRREDLYFRIAANSFDKDNNTRELASFRDFYSGRIALAKTYRLQDRFITEMERIARLPAWQRESASRRIQEEIIETRSKLHLLMIPQAHRAWRNSASIVAENALARVAVALARFHGATGSYASRLDDLVPAYLAKIPLDPWTDQPFRYAIKDGAAVVYSLGFDRDDDGGRAIADQWDEDDFDVVWTVKRKK